MFMNILQWISNKVLKRHKKDNNDLDIKLPISLTREQMLNSIDLSSCSEPEILKPDVITEDTKVLLVLDDLQSAFVMLDFDIKEFKKMHNLDVYKDYIIVKCEGNNAGVIAYNYLKNNKVDKAYLDVTLANRLIKIDENNYLEIDGVDIAIELHKRYPDCEIAICTSHNMHDNNTQVKDYIDKFEKYTNRSMKKCYVNRLTARSSCLYNLLTTEMYKYENVKKE